MANLTITAGSVGIKSQISKSLLYIVQYGETVTNGQPVYLKASDGKYWLAATDTAAEAACVGVALTGGAADGWGIIAISGASINVGATLTVSEIYAIGSTDGTIAPESDLTTSAKFPCVLGYATAADTLVLNIQTSGVAIP